MKIIKNIKLPDGETYEIGGGSSLPIGSTVVLDKVLSFEESQGLALQGTYVYKTAVAGERYGYPDFYNTYVGYKNNATATQTTLGSSTITIYNNANGLKFYNIADKGVIDTFFNSTGIADFYGIDEANERIFLPRNNKFWQFTTNTGEVNNYVEAGLPNITGGFDLIQMISADTASGAFRVTKTSTNYGSRTSGSQQDDHFTFDASRSSSVYGKSNTVQPPSSKKLLYYVVGNTSTEKALTEVTEITTSENDTLPLFYSFYSKEDMTTTGAYVNASLGAFLSGNVYTTAYNELVNKLGTDNVKSITDEYTDYDFVVNQDDMTFRLPIKNGNEDLADWENAIINITTPYTATENGYITGYAATQGDVYYRINGVLVGETAGTSGWASRGNIQVLVKKGDVFTLQNNPTDGTSFNFVPAKGNGNLYYKLSNAVTNLELLDAGKVMNAVNTVVPNNASLISSYGMPSSKYIDLTLNASGSTYTAPANGWFSIRKLTDSTSHRYVQLTNTTKGIICRLNDTGISGSLLAGYLPVSSNDKVRVDYSATGNTEHFRFYYAEGEV